MKKNKCIKNICLLLVVVFVVITVKIVCIPQNLKISCNNINVLDDYNRNLKSNFFYSIDSKQCSNQFKSKANSKKYDLSVKLFGVIPVKTMTLNVVPEIKLVPGGQPIGVKLYTNGILVVGYSDIETPNGKKQSPAAINGVEIGDSIVEINNVKVKDIQELSKMISENKGSNIKLKLNRKGKIINTNLIPFETKNKDGYKMGIWVRDSTAGVGTLTFYELSTGKFGALGHPINDIDTGTLLSIKDGRIYNANIVSIEQGTKGKPGELRGTFSDEDEIGILNRNTTEGIYGKIKGSLSYSLYNKPLSIGNQNEVKEGPAKILTSVDGSKVKEYDINIEKAVEQSKPTSKGMIIRVTDKELLSKTGGIVQGMSGSPIIQNDKIVGAVTHVFVNRPDMGYGIYIEWMLKQAGID